MRLLRQICQDQALPVQVQIVHVAQGFQQDAGPFGQRLHQQMDLRVVAQRLEMADAFHGFFDRFLIQDMAGVDGDAHAEAVFDDLLQHFDLHLAHQLGADLLQLRIPDDAQHRVFLRQLRQFLQCGVRIRAVRRRDPVGEYGLQQGFARFFFFSHRLTRIGLDGAAQRGDLPGFDPVRRFVFRAAVDADLADLFPLQFLAHFQLPSGELDPGEPRAVFGAGDLKDAAPQILRPMLFLDAVLQAVQEILHAFQLQRGTEPALSKWTPKPPSSAASAAAMSTQWGDSLPCSSCRISCLASFPRAVSARSILLTHRNVGT